MEKGPQFLMNLEEKDNVVPFEKPKKLQLITGGGDPPTENWLAQQPKGTILLARDRVLGGQKPPLVLEAYMVANQALPEATNLYLRTPDGNSIDIWVPTLEFSRRKELIKVLAYADLDNKEQETDEEAIDGNSEGTV